MPANDSFVYNKSALPLNTINQNLIRPEMNASMDASDAETISPYYFPRRMDVPRSLRPRSPSKRTFSTESTGSPRTPGIKKKRKNESGYEILKAPFFKHVKCQSRHNGVVERVLVFQRDNPNLCFEYSLHTSAKQQYYCYHCKPLGANVKLRIFRDPENGDYVKLIGENHRCEPEVYDPSKFLEVTSNGSTMQTGAVMSPAVRGRPRTTFGNSMGSTDEGPVNVGPALSLNVTNPVPEPVDVPRSLRPRICNTRPLNGGTGYGSPAIKKHSDSGTEILKPPNFKVVKVQNSSGGLIEKVIVFIRDDPSLYYEYTICNSVTQTFYCYRCKPRCKNVKLQLFKDAKNGDFIKLSTTPHRCEPQTYDPSKFIEVESNGTNVPSTPTAASMPQASQGNSRTRISNNNVAATVAAGSRSATRTTPYLRRKVKAENI